MFTELIKDIERAYKWAGYEKTSISVDIEEWNRPTIIFGDMTGAVYPYIYKIYVNFTGKTGDFIILRFSNHSGMRHFVDWLCLPDDYAILHNQDRLHELY